MCTLLFNDLSAYIYYDFSAYTVCHRYEYLSNIIKIHPEWFTNDNYDLYEHVTRKGSHFDTKCPFLENISGGQKMPMQP